MPSHLRSFETSLAGLYRHQLFHISFFYLRFLLLHARKRAPPRVVALSAFQPPHRLHHASVCPLRVFERRKFGRGRVYGMFQAHCAVISRRLHMSFRADLHGTFAPDALLSTRHHGIGFGLLHRHLFHHRCWILPQHGRRFLPVHGRLHHRFRHPRRRGRGTEEVEEGEEGFEHGGTVAPSQDISITVAISRSMFCRNCVLENCCACCTHALNEYFF